MSSKGDRVSLPLSFVDGPRAPVHIFYGDDEFFLDERITEARAWTSHRVSFVEGSQTSEDEIVDRLEAFEEERQVVVLDNADRLKASKGRSLREFIDERTEREMSSVLIAVIRKGKLPEAWKCDKPAVTAFYTLPPPWKIGEDLPPWVQLRAKSLGLKFDTIRTVEIFVEHTAGDRYRIASELKKIRLFLEGTSSSTITTNELNLVLAPSRKADAREIVDATFAKNAKLAMDQLSTLYRNESSDPSVKVTYGLMNEIQRLIYAKAMQQQGLSASDIAGVLNMHPWRCKSFFLPVVEKHSMASLLQHMKRLCKLDLDVKGASSSPRTLVELTVLSIAG